MTGGTVLARIAFALRDSPSWMAVETTDPQRAADELAFELEESVATLVLVHRLDDDALRELDRTRNRHMGEGARVFVGTRPDLDRLARLAPHVWSLVGPDYWTVDLDGDLLDVEARLASLRRETGLSDEDVVRRAQAGKLPPDPRWAEWLALLGRGDLIGG